MKPCPECLTKIEDKASVCKACGKRISGKDCPECAEISKTAANVCQYCGHNFAKKKRQATLKPVNVTASILPALLQLTFRPQEIHITQEKIVIRTYAFFGLTKTDEDIPWEKVAGYDYHTGLIWDGLRIQTRGQTANAIQFLPKDGGLQIRAVFELMKQ